MARRSSKSSGSTGNGRNASPSTGADDDRPDSIAAEGEATADSGATPVADTVPDAETVAADANDIADREIALGESAAADADETPAGSAGDDSVMPTDATAVEEGDSPSSDATPEPAQRPAPAPAAYEQSSGPGFVPLILGGVIAAGIGYGAAYMGYLPTGADTTSDTTAITAALEAQNETLAALQAQVSELANAEPVMPEMPEIPTVDLGPVTEQIQALSTQIDGTTSAIADIAARVTVLEERPVFTGDVDEDNAAAVAAVGQLQEELRAQQEAAAAEAAALQAAAAEAANAAAQAEAAAAEAAQALAAAEADAADAVAAAAAAADTAMAEAQAAAALREVQLAMTSGAPFAEPLAVLAGVVDTPDSLTAVADTGVPTLEAIEAGFAPAARAALPVALRETAGDSTADRLGAFLMGQIGGRAIEPREGDDPDSVLSRVGAAVQAGDLQEALTEIASLPDGARAELAPWVADVEIRAAAETGLAQVTAALSGTE
ncbi:MAG: hypothetical protein RIB61_17640 [Roseicyclus sp.]